MGLQQGQRLAVAPVGGLDIFLVELAADIGDAADRHGMGSSRARDLALQLGQLGEGQSVVRSGCACDSSMRRKRKSSAM